MSSVAISGNASGAGVFTIAAPNSASSFTATLPAATTTLVGTDATQTLTNKTLTSPTITGAVVSSMASSVITSGTAQASTSGTSIDFTLIPSWVKRITVMLSGVSTLSTSSNFLIQIGYQNPVTSTGYASRTSFFQGATLGGSNSSAGFIAGNYGAANTTSGAITLTLLGSNTWVATGYLADSGSNASATGGTSPALGGVLDRVRITTVGGTDTFDLGSINILYE